jgi:hypothetical protein
MAKKVKSTITATIVNITEDSINYYVDIQVAMGASNLMFNVITAMSSFTDIATCTTWLTNWVSTNKTSILATINSNSNGDSLFAGITVTG